MKSKTFNQLLYVLIFLLIASLACASMSMDDLINSYDYSYTEGTLNVTAQNDYMIDANGNGLNDTLIINITTDAAASGTYSFIVTILDRNRIITNETSKAINSSSKSVNINFPSAHLSKAKFNYSIIINDANNDLVFRNSNIESRDYPNYESGTNITMAKDESMSNNFLRINLTINSTQAMTKNITVTLAYNSSKISKTNEITLSSGMQTVNIDFDNETVKSTHYTGNFTIDSATIGENLFYINRNTSVYNYEDFAKTSYIKSISDVNIDTDSNNLSEFLEINFTINVLTAENYNLTYDLYNQFNNYVISVNKSQTLSLGNQTMQTLINGSEIYKTKINAPYVISFVKLLIGNDTKDILFNPFATNQSSYLDYERPPLPDMKVSMQVVFNESTNITNITVNISNIGKIPAFNVFLDIFDNSTYADNRSVSFLNNDETMTYEFNITNSSNATLYTSIVDFDGLIDESNESNNIVQNIQTIETVSLQIESISSVYSNETYKIFEFVILNNGDATVTDIEWRFDTNDSSVINSTYNITSLAQDEKEFVYVHHNYSDEGAYQVRANATGLRSSNKISSSLTSSLAVGDLEVTNFNGSSKDLTRVVFEVQATNFLETNITNVNWSLNTGNGDIINSKSLFPVISPNETIFIFVKHDFGTIGLYSPSVTVTNITYSDTESMNLNLRHIEAYNLSIVNESGSRRVFELIIKNNLDYNLTNVNWTIDTKNSEMINSTINDILQSNEQIFVYIDYNFTASGNFLVNSSAINGSLRDYRNLTVTV